MGCFKQDNPDDPCCDCTYGTDNFNRADGAPGAKWDTTGTVAIQTPVLLDPAIQVKVLGFTGANSFAVFQTPHPDGTPYSEAVADWATPSDGDEFRVHLDNVDPDNVDDCHYAQITWDSGAPELSIYKNTAGVPTLLAGPLLVATPAPGPFYAIPFRLRAHIGICDASEDIYFVATSTLGDTLSVVITPHGGTYAALSVGALTTGAAEADDFSVSRSFMPDVPEDAECPPCYLLCTEACEDGLPPNMALSIPGYGDVGLQEDSGGFDPGNEGPCTRYGGFALGTTAETCIAFVKLSVDVTGVYVTVITLFETTDSIYQNVAMGDAPFDCNGPIDLDLFDDGSNSPCSLPATATLAAA